MNKQLMPCLLAAAALGLHAQAALVIPGANGTDGELLITTNTVIDLAQAVDAAWDSDNTPNAGKGVYDSGKWAVVFKYSRVTVNAGATVTFKNHPSRAPVVWLVNGDAVIAGAINLNGSNGDADPNRQILSEPGPGGFRGGDGPVPGASVVEGLGPGGGMGVIRNQFSQYASHSTPGPAWNRTPAPTYGNALILPLIGGSGSGGDSAFSHSAGGAGGGAFFLAVRDELDFTGTITAQSGNGQASDLHGSGGAVRLACERAKGSGLVTVNGGYAWGRIRLECATYEASYVFQPPIFPTAPTSPIQLWPAPDAPTARIVSVSGVSAPADPRSSMDLSRPADLRLPAGSRTNSVLIETTGLPTNAMVILHVVSIPGQVVDRFSGVPYVSTDAADAGRHFWRQEVVIPPGHHSLQVLARTP
jgi:plastocyanin